MIQTTSCRCGAAVTRELPDPPAVQLVDGGLRPLGVAVTRLLAKVPALCDSCVRQVEAEDATREAQERAEAARVRREQRIRRADLPAALRGLGWDALEVDERADAIAAARAWSDGRLRGLVLTGPVGAGKTRIAATAAWQYLLRGGLRWTSMPVLLARLGGGHNDHQRRLAVELMTGSQALVLDDLDKTRPTAYGAEQVFAVIDNRITAGAPLLVTTNLSFGELGAMFPEPFGEAIVSRLAGYCRAHRVAGCDRRLVRAAA
jgi:DNA replication protein DnaC